MVSVLMVAEKPSICNAIANALCSGKMDTKSGSPPVHSFNGTFKGKSCTFKVTSVVGHVFSVDFPQEYQNWGSTDPLELFNAPVRRQAEKQGIVRLLQSEASGCEYLVLWLDCDREGENICFEVISCVQSGMVKLKSKEQQIFRAKFSAINPSDIKKAMKNLGSPNENESKAVDARQELDLKVGVAFSRFQTRYFQGRYGDLDSSVVSYGPCQTPTLGFCVRRHIDIVTFQSEPYWALNMQILKGGRKVRAEWGRGRVFSSEVAAAFLSLVSSTGCVRVETVTTKSTKKGRPTPLNTVGMLKMASKVLGMGPFQCMQVAERLYLRGYLSYPRTESTAYPKSHDISGSLRDQSAHPHWGSFAQQLVRDGHTKPKGGVDMGDHPPITPCKMAQPHELGGDEGRLYDLVTRHFIATVSPDAEFFETKATLIAGEQPGDKSLAQSFVAKGRRLMNPGFLAVLKGFDMKAMEDEPENGEEYEDPWDDYQESMPDLVQGEVLPILEKSAPGFQDGAVMIQLAEKKTTPPGYLTESELIGQMERFGIGTDASIPTHINNICKRNYVTLEKGRKLVPTKLGIVLVQGYFRIDSDLILPTVRASIESQCNLIAKGEADKDEVVQQAINNFIRKYQYYVRHISRMDELFASSFSALESAGRPWTRCGISRRYLSFIEGPPTRLYNKTTETVYSLPQGGVFKQWGERTCDAPGCSFEVMLYCVGSPQRSYPLCPNCFNNPDESWGPTWEQTPDKLAEEVQSPNRKCLESPLPDGHPMIEAFTVCDDPESDGVFILDPGSGPKWKFISTRSSFCVNLPKGVVKKSCRDEETRPGDSTATC
mmetsp:Transcript_35891/g.57265  ORF Transcript_35891/g.57265 Transcript_35891/m.57265 type:complete len:828 (-) Transcript_35891:259-2742(-)